MADETLQPACNVPRLLIWPKQVALRQNKAQTAVQQQQPQNVVPQQQDKVCAVQQPALHSDLAITNDQSQNSENIDDVDEFEETVNEESFAEEMERIELTQISNESQFETTNAPIAVPLIEEVRKYPCIWNIASSSHKDKPKKWKRGEGLPQC